MQIASDSVYVVLVSGKLKDGHLPKMMEQFKPLAEYVQAHEDGCLSYQLSTGEDNSLIIFERYVSKAYLEDVHWQSAAFKAFGAGMREQGVEWESKTVTKYFETPIGFMARS